MLFKKKEGRAVEALERIAAALEVLAFHRRPPSDGKDVSEIMYVDDEHTLAMELVRELYTARTGKRLREDEKIPEVPGKDLDEPPPVDAD